MSAEEESPRASGPETWSTVAGCEWSWWDLWCCVSAIKEHDGDLDALADAIAARIRDRARFESRDSDDARLSHLFDLTDRLAATGIGPTDLAGPDVLADRKITGRARAKFKGRIPEGAYARSGPMRDLPRQRLQRRARYGLWSSFPVDPTVFYDKFRPTVDRSYAVEEHQTGRIVRILNDRLASLDGPRRSLAERLALYRAFYTAAEELADIADDSYGYLGDLRTEIWLAYLDIDWRATGMSPGDYWADVCGLHLWEDYGLDHRNEHAWFRTATRPERTLIETILSGLADEARTFILDYQADKARTAITRLRSTTPSRRMVTDG